MLRISCWVKKIWGRISVPNGAGHEKGFNRKGRWSSFRPGSTGFLDECLWCARRTLRHSGRQPAGVGCAVRTGPRRGGRNAEETRRRRRSILGPRLCLVPQVLEALLPVVCIRVTPVARREAEPPRGRFPGREAVQEFDVGWAEGRSPTNGAP